MSNRRDEEPIASCLFTNLGNPRCNIIYSFSLSGLGSLFRMFCSLCFTSAVSNKLYYTGDEPKMWRTWIIFLPQWLAVSPYEILDIDTSSALSKLGIISMSSSIAIKLVKRFVVLNNENKCIATLNLRWFYVNKLNRYILYIEIFGDLPLTRAGKMETVHWCTRRRAGTNKTGAKARENIQCKIGIRFVHLWPYGSIHYFEWLLMVIYPVLVT